MTTKAILRELLPLYAEDLLSEESRLWVEEQLSAHPDCQAELDGLTVLPQATSPSQPLDFLTTTVKKEKCRFGLAILSTCWAVIVLAITALTLPLHIDNDGQLFTVQQEGQDITVLFDSRVSRVKLTQSRDETGQNVVFLDAYTTRLDQLFPGQHQVYVRRPSSDVVFYDNHSRAADLLAGQTSWAGAATLPRLFLSAYALLALALLLVLSAGFALRRWVWKKQTSHQLVIYSLGLPASFLLAWLTITGLSGTSYYASQELVAILSLTGAYYLLLHALYQLKTNRL
ncbi:hypothetical protein ABID29_001239 [Streptococcus rupicaprae]|uniref:Zf-HC2 domain-containing protein n=1 Tax=Streptococcus rupicaprae TaxID=759619 RepID=A0ABV2FHT4_9STRE